MRILLVEDDLPLARALKQSLHSANFSVDCVHQGKDALHALTCGGVNMLILDLGLPDIDGIELLKKIKAKHKKVPVLILTARDDSHSKVNGLDQGADDYLVKPFDMAELFARLRVIERRIGTVDTAIINVSEVTLDTTANRLYVAQQPINLSRREYMIVKSLLENLGRIQSKDSLENKLYEWGEEIASNTIEVHIHNIRKKLPKDFIKTIRGVGYVINKP